MMLRANYVPDHIPPITLDHAWPKQGRLLWISVACSIFGCLMNGFFIAAFFINDYLKRVGLVFQASVGLSDMIISMGVIPVSAYVSVSGVGVTAGVCNALQFLIVASTYSYSIFFAIMSVQNFYHLRRPDQQCNVFISKRGDLIAVLIIFIISFTFAGVGTYTELDYDGCYRNHSGNTIYRNVTFFIFHAVPCLITVSLSMTACIVMTGRAIAHIDYRNGEQYTNDRYALYVNIIVYLLYAGAWIPLLITFDRHVVVNDSPFYRYLWLGVGRSVLTSFLYGVLDGNFRRAYGHLICWLLCLRAFSGCGVRRHRRNPQIRGATGDFILRSIDRSVRIGRIIHR